jgi:hypothetical protein
MSRELFLNKGVRIKGVVQHTYLPCLSGMQMKFGLEYIPVEGVIRHIRSDVPNPRADQLTIFIDLDPEADAAYKGPKIDLGCPCGHPHVPVRPRHVRDTVGEPIASKDAVLVLDLQEAADV